jgi:hypothetical protein
MVQYFGCEPVYLGLPRHFHPGAFGSDVEAPNTCEQRTHFQGLLTHAKPSFFM